VTARAPDAFAALSSPVRRDLLNLLLHGGPCSVQDLASSFDMARPSVSEHLKVLRDVGLVSEERQGRHRVYQLQPEPLQDVRAWLEPYEQFWRARLGGFAALLDEQESSSSAGVGAAPESRG